MAEDRIETPPAALEPLQSDAVNLHHRVAACLDGGTDLVVEPGRYVFMDFVKIGVPLLLTYLATALVAPLVFPFAG